METYYLRSFGCQMNDHDAERIRALLEADGLVRVASLDDADVIVYNTCTVRRSADERFFGHLGGAARIKKEHPERRLVVCGCLPQAEGRAFLDEHPFVDLVFGPQNLHRLRDALHCAERPAGFFDDTPLFSGELPSCRERRLQAWLQVMSGCANHCTYCIVPRVRGAERSRAPAAVVAEARRLVADGVLEITLLGQNVNAYGRDLAQSGVRTTFASLLAELDTLEDLRRLRFTTSHPRDLSDDLIAAIADLDSVCEHLHLPAQSGSDDILRAMGRGYTIDEYVGRVEAVRAAVPDIAITTDLLVGFPGETDADFEATLELVRRAGFDAAFTFVFSPRPGTPAARLAPTVPAMLARRRIDRLVEVTQAQGLERRNAVVGSTREVLVEGASRRGGLSRGRTRQNVTVNFEGDVAPGALVPVRIIAATSTTLRGRIEHT